MSGKTAAPKAAPAGPVFDDFQAWAEKFRAAPTPEDKAALLPEGEALAQARRAEMARLIQADPEQALERALPYGLRKALPPTILANLEEPVNARGDFNVVRVQPLPETEKAEGRMKNEETSQRAVTIGQKRYDAFTYGARLHQPSHSGIPLHGIALTDPQGRDVMALSAEAVRFVEADEAQDLIAEGKVQWPPAPAAAPAPAPVVVQAGEKFFAFADARIARQFNRALQAAEGRWQARQPAPAQRPPDELPPPGRSATQLTGKILYLPVLFADDPVPPQSPDAAQALGEAINQFYNDNSYGTLNWLMTVTPPLRLPERKNFYGENIGRIVPDAVAVAATLGYLASDYDLTYVLFNPVPQFNFLGRADGLLNGQPGILPVLLGFNLGVPTSDYWNTSGRTPPPPRLPPPPLPPYPTDSDGLIGHDDINAPWILDLAGDAPIEPGGDIYDLMGSGLGHFNVIFKNFLNWLPDQFLRPVETSATNRVYAFDIPRVTDGRIYALTVYKDVFRSYWISVRQGFPNNPWMANGLELMWDLRPLGLGPVLLDSTSATAPGKNDAAVIVGRTFPDPASSIYITPVAQGGQGSDKWVDVVVNLGPFPTNQPPTVTLAASSLSVSNGATVTFTATAQDANGDVLAYNWDFGDLSFGTNGPILTKTFTADGHYPVRVEVSDMKGGVASAHVIVTVGNPTTFVMSGRVVDIFGDPVQGVRVHNGHRTAAYQAPAAPGDPPRPPPTNSVTYRYAYTDSQGRYTIGNIPPGTYTNRAFLFGYRIEPDFVNPVRLESADALNFNHIATPLPHVRIDERDDAREDGAVFGGVNVSRDGDVSQDLLVRYILTGTATLGEDYVAPPGNIYTNLMITTNSMGELMTNMTTRTNIIGRVVIPAGETAAPIDIIGIDNALGDGDKTVLVTLMLHTNAPRVFTVATNVVETTNGLMVTNSMFITLTNDAWVPGWELLPVEPTNTLTWFQTYPTYIISPVTEATVNILDDDPPNLPQVGVFALDTDAIETRADTATLLFFRLNASLNGDLVLHYTLTGDAAEGVDYASLPGQVTIPAGEVFTLVTLQAVNDLFVEGNELVNVALTPDLAYNIIPQFGSEVVVIVDDDLPLVTLYASDSVAAQTGPNPGRVTVARVGDLTAPLVVDYLVTGTAISGIDFQPLPQTLVIPAGQITADILILPIDTGSPGAKTVTILLSDTPSYNIYNQNTATVTIQDTLPVVSLTVTAPVAAEGAAVGTFTVTRTGPTANSLTVFFEVGGSAFEGSDYSPIGTNVVIPTGATAANIDIVALGVNDDFFREFGDVSGNDNVILHLRPGSDYNVGTPDSGTVQIADNEPQADLPAVGFMLRHSTVLEQDMFTNLIPVKCSANPDPDKPIWVDYRVIGGTALPNVNYQPITGTTGLLTFVNFPTPLGGPIRPEDTIGYVELVLLNDRQFTGDRTVILRLFNPIRFETNTSVVMDAMGNMFTNVLITPVPTNAVLGDFNLHTVTILDVGDNTVSVAADTAAVYEAGAVGGHFVLTRAGPTSRPLTVYFTTTGTAANGSDYQIQNSELGILNSRVGSATIPAGTNVVQLDIIPIDDPEEEPAESIILTLLERPGYMRTNFTAQTVLVSDDGTLQFSRPTFAVDENAGPALISVLRSGDTNRTSTVEYEITDGTATGGADYLPTNGTLTFLPGETIQSFTVAFIDDSAVEPDETVNLALRNPTGGAPLGGQATATLTIRNDDTAFELATNLFRANENASTAPILIQRRGLTNANAFVTLTTRDATATNNTDYRAFAAQVFFAPGELSQEIPIQLIDDVAFEGDETVDLQLSDPSPNTTLGPISNATLRIVDDECSLAFTATNFVISEYAQFAQVQVARTGGTVNPVLVDLATRNGTALSPNDYVTLTATLQFAGDALLLDTNGTGQLVFVPGETNKIINIRILDDTLGEGVESFGVRLSRARAASASALPGSVVLGRLGTPTNANVSILDDETPGAVDFPFNAGAGPNARVLSVALQPGGETVFGGEFTEVNRIDYNRVARLLGNGVLDSFFNPGQGANGLVQVVASQPDGKVLLGGQFTTLDRTNRTRLARLNANGALDLTFNPGSGPDALVRAIVVQADGKVLIAGDFSSVNAAGRTRVARLNADGTLDSGFTASVSGGSVYALAFQLDGVQQKILLGGNFTSVNGTNRNGLARLNTNGTLDLTFNPGTGANGLVRSLAVQADGKVLLGGAFTSVNGLALNYLARLEQGGAVDTGFNPGSGPNGVVNSVAVHPTGRIYLGGAFTSVDGVTRQRYARLRPSGALDLLFDPGAGANATVQTVAVQPDTALVIGGDFTLVNGLPRSYITRIHGDEKFTGVEFAAPAFFVPEDAPGFATITVQRVGNTNSAFSVGFRATNGTALAPADFRATNGTLNFAVGQLTATFRVPILDDNLLEGDETVNLFLTNATAGVDLSGVTVAVLVIQDNENAVQFAAANYVVDEGATNALIAVARSGSAGTVTVGYAASNGSALAGVDYTGVTNTLSFGPGETNKAFPVPILNDAAGEAAETVNLRLFDPVGATLADLTNATLTILDNDVFYGTATYSNLAEIVILDGSQAAPYPSVINVAGLTGLISRVSVTLAGFYHTFPADVDVLLGGPQGQAVTLMSDAGGSLDAFGATLRFDDEATNSLPQTAQILSSTNRPTDYGPADVFPAPAPAGPFASALAAFVGSEPNGPWSLYVVDDRGVDSGVFSNGWQLTISTVDPARATDLALALTDAPDPILAGQPLTYSLSVTNHGPLLATNVTLSDTLPAGVNYLGANSSQGSCALIQNAEVKILNCALGDLPVGAVATVGLQIVPLQGGVITNSAVVTAGVPDLNFTNNTATAATTVAPATTADLNLALSAAPDPVLAGQELTYLIAVTNRGPLTASNVTIEDPLPENVQFISASVSQGTFRQADDRLIFDVGTLGLGASATARVIVRPRAAGTVTNSVTAFADPPDVDPENRATAITTVHPATDLVVTINDRPDPVPLSGQVTFVVTVQNLGPSPATSVTLFNSLPAQLPLVSAATSQGSNYVAGSTVVFAFGTLSNGASATATIVARGLVLGIFTNVASAISAQADPAQANNSALEATTVSGQVVGGIGIINNGTVQLGVYPAGHLNVPGNVPSSGSPINTTFVGLRYIPTGAESTADGCLCEGWGVADALSGVAGGANESSDGGPFGLVVESFVADGVTATSTVRVFGQNSNAPPTFRVTHFYHPSVVSNLYQVDVRIENTSSREVHVLYRRVMDWDIEPTAFQEYATMIKGDSPNLVFTSDNGFASANPLAGPSQILVTGTFVDSGPADHGALFDFDFGRLQPGASQFFRTYYGAAGTEEGANFAIARVGAEAYSYGQPSTPNGATEGTPNTFIFAFGGIGGSALVGADVAVFKESAPNPVLLGDPLTYTLVVTNNGPETANDVVLEDLLPAEVSLVSVDASQGAVTIIQNFEFKILNWNVGDLVKGAGATVILVVLPNIETSVTNVATVLALQPDGNTDNNFSTNVTLVVSVGTFVNREPIFIADGAPAIPYPSVIRVSGVDGLISKVTASLVELTHTFPADLDILLVGPQGQQVLLMSDVGQGDDLDRVTLKFDDAAPSFLSATNRIGSGTYKPTNVGANDFFFYPAPAEPYGDALSVFNETDPNGDWLLYVMDDQGSDAGSLAGGWRLTISTAGGGPPPQLHIALEGTEVVLSWPASASGYVLESSDLAPPISWNLLTDSPPVVGDHYEVRLTVQPGKQYFRLRKL